MKKRKTLLSVVIIILFIAGVFSVVLYKIGDRVFDEMIDIQLEAIEDKINLEESNVGVSIGGQDIGSVQSNTSSDASADSSSTASTTIPTTIPTTKGEATSTQPIIVKPQDNQQTPNEATNITDKPSEASNQTIKNEVIISKEDIKEIKDNITTLDKMTVAAMMIKNLTKADIDRLSLLAANGITEEERAEAKKIIFSRFSNEEIEKIKDYYTKYAN